jgi:acetylornithine/N-succinyldiaminopimelate aminotransferase
MYYYARGIFAIVRSTAMSLHTRESATFMHTYKRLPLEIQRGEGVHLYTGDGTRYLDMFSGLAVNALGYGHPRVVKAIEDQTRKYVHLSNYYLQEPQITLAELLVRHTGFPRVFFANSGTETTEGVIKIARRWGSSRAKTEILSLSNSFHGRTMGALSLMDRPKYRNGFGPFLDQCTVVPFNDPGALRTAVKPDTAAIILEFIQGEGGIRPVSMEFARTLRELQEHFGFLVIADEIQSGIGRTGTFFGYQHFDVKPDLVTIAKPLGGGLPLGAILATEPVGAVLEPGMHGTTFGGNPVACAAGCAVILEIIENGLVRQAETLGNLLMGGLNSLKKDFPDLVREIRGFGLMVGMELTRDGEPYVTAMRERKILINCTDQTALRFLPPLIIERSHIEETLAALRAVFAAIP